MARCQGLLNPQYDGCYYLSSSQKIVRPRSCLPQHCHNTEELGMGRRSLASGRHYGEVV